MNLMPADLTLIWHNREAYALALEVGNYRAAAYEAIAALRRRDRGTEASWRMRLAGCLRARHERRSV